MAYQVLYRLYRPIYFKDVVGQEVITQTLQNSIKQNKIANAYLFCGPRGTGKTSLAKIMASAINCTNFNGEICGECANCKEALNGTHPDIVEFDAASYSKVEQIREVLKNVNYQPSLGRYKVYIIDEVHQLSNSASSALLKTIEEPPANVVFILATTDPEKVLPTIQSRCQRYDFFKIESSVIKDRMAYILKKENRKYEDKALDIIASLAEGGMRDALSILEQCLAYSSDELKEEDINKIYGLVSRDEQIIILKNIHNGNISSAIKALHEINAKGSDMRRFGEDLITDIKESLLYSVSDEEILEYLTPLQAQEILKINYSDLLKDIDILMEALNNLKTSLSPLSILELTFLKIANYKQPSSAKIQINTIQENIKANKDIPEIINVSRETVNNSDNKSNELIDIPKTKEYESATLEYPKEELLDVLLRATKEEKNNDKKYIYENLENYAYSNDRKFYIALKNTDIFASSDDFILLQGNDISSLEINDSYFNDELYSFMRHEFGIEKSVYYLIKKEKEELVEFYKDEKNHSLARHIKIKKHSNDEDIPANKEEELYNIFGSKLKIIDK